MNFEHCFCSYRNTPPFLSRRRHFKQPTFYLSFLFPPPRYCRIHHSPTQMVLLIRITFAHFFNPSYYHLNFSIFLVCRTRRQSHTDTTFHPAVSLTHLLACIITYLRLYTVHTVIKTLILRQFHNFSS